MLWRATIRANQAYMGHFFLKLKATNRTLEIMGIYIVRLPVLVGEVKYETEVKMGRQPSTQKRAQQEAGQ
jgi:hypothetical protein